MSNGAPFQAAIGRDGEVPHGSAARGFYTVPPAERTRRGLCGTLPASFCCCFW